MCEVTFDFAELIKLFGGPTPTKEMRAFRRYYRRDNFPGQLLID